MNKKMYKPTSTFLAPRAEYEGQFPNANTRSLFSNETENGFAMEWVCADQQEGIRPLLSQTLYGKFALCGLGLSLKGFSYTAKSDFKIVFDGGKEQIFVMLGNDAPFVKSGDSILPLDKYKLCRENLVDKQIVVEWQNNAVCITAGENSQTVEVVIPENFDVSAVRVSIEADGIDNAFTLECDGVYADTNGKVKELVDAIENLTEDTFDAVYNTYINLEVEKRPYVFNFAKLNDFRLALRARQGVDQNGFDKDGFYIPTMADIEANGGDCPKGVATTPAKNGGLHIDFNHGAFGQRQYLNNFFIGEDITIRLDNYNCASGGLVVGLTSSPIRGDIWNLTRGAARYGIYMLIGLDSRIYVTLPFELRKMIVMMEDPIFAPENLQGKEIIINFGYIAKTREISVSFTVDGKTITKNFNDFGINPNDNNKTGKRMYGGSNDLFNCEKVMVVIQSTQNYLPDGTFAPNALRSNHSVDFTGFKYKEFSCAQQEKIDERIAAIDALPEEPSLEIEDKVNEVWSHYFKLCSVKMRSGVTNYDKLKRLHDGIFALKKGDKKSFDYDGEHFNADTFIDNSALTTRYKPHEEVNYDTQNMWPEWTKDCVVAACRVETATKEGTFMAMEPVLKHFAEIGVSVLWLTPIEDVGIGKIRSTYCNYGPHTICPYLTGQIKRGEPYDPAKVDYKAGWKVFAEFIEMAHKYNIRVLMDKVPWGLAKEAPMVAEHPDWFKGPSSWGGLDYHMDHPEVIAYYKGSIIQSVVDSRVDGIRWDLEPNYFAYDLVEEIHEEVDKLGFKTLFIAEDQSIHGKAYAFSQFGDVNGVGVTPQLVSPIFLNDIDVVEAVKTGQNIGHRKECQAGTSGQHKYYSYQISSHDVLAYRRAPIGCWAYEFILASFIPLFYLGEEWCTKQKGGIYGVDIGWHELCEKEHKEYFETVKKYMSLRWKYKDIINSNVDNHRDTNICQVDAVGTDLVRPYARYKDNRAIIVVPNFNERSNDEANITIEIPFEKMGIDGYKTYTLVDLMTDKEITRGSKEELSYFSRNIKHGTCDVYLLTAIN